MKLFSRILFSSVLTAVVCSVAASAQSARVGAAAPAFSAVDSRGQLQSLDQFHGRYVVLEWSNADCPYTNKQYATGKMQSLQKEWTAKGVVWLTVLSSAQGKQGYLTAEQENLNLAKQHAAPTAALIDAKGELGRLYNIKTTPQMVVIDPKGKIVYDGAVDNRPTVELVDVISARNYANEALVASIANRPVANAYVRPYGCSVKYAN